MRLRISAVLWMLGALLICPLAAADDTRARNEYILYCAGCHGFDGAALARGRIPALKDSMADFLRVSEGRAYLVQVPGVNNSGMNNEQIARVVNWSLRAFTERGLPPDFVPYSAAEVAGYRADRPVDIVSRRRQLLQRLAQLGVARD